MTTTRKVGLAAAALAAAALIATPLVKQFEGRSLDPYRDIVGIKTVCDGETNVEMRHYSNAECDALTEAAIRDTYGPQVLTCTPDIGDRPKVFAAAISLTYNIGAAAYCRSTVARRFNAHDWVGGCNAFLAWRFAGGREVAGLLNRRRAERALCLEGAA